MILSNTNFNVLYVDPSAASAGDGGTPASALKALPAAASGIADGTCYLILRTAASEVQLPQGANSGIAAFALIVEVHAVIAAGGVRRIDRIADRRVRAVAFKADRIERTIGEGRSGRREVSRRHHLGGRGKGYVRCRRHARRQSGFRVG